MVVGFAIKQQVREHEVVALILYKFQKQLPGYSKKDENLGISVNYLNLNITPTEKKNETKNHYFQ
jgi:hypothetical protein